MSNNHNRDDEVSKTAEGARSAIEAAKDEQKLRLFAEELSVRKELAETGRVRVKTHTVEEEALVDEDLFHEHAEIETVPVGKRIFVTPPVRREGDTTIVPVVEEVLHTERRLILKEEIHIRMVRTVERHHETVVLRHQEAVVERSRDEAVAAAPAGSAPDSK